MKFDYDKVADAVYVTLKKGKIVKTKGDDQLVLDYDRKGSILGFEILNFSKYKKNNTFKITSHKTVTV